MSSEPLSKGDFWTEPSAARRYREARPYFHPIVMDLIRRRIGLEPEQKLAHGIDVGCGTGQSTVALLKLVDTATGVDNAEQMLAHAEARECVEYRIGTAEQLPAEANSADIVTASLAIHWFDLPIFLAEAQRVLRPGGWLITYSNGFRAQMVGNPEFHEWCGYGYAARYPTPPRAAYNPPDDTFAGSPFELVSTDDYSNEVDFTPEQLVAYLMTHSNVVAKVEQGSESAADVRAWLSEQVQPFFSHKSETFLFGGAITYTRLA